MEQLIADALMERGIAFTRDDRNAGKPQSPNDIHLDFHLVKMDIYIEVKRFHSDRIARQMAKAENVIVAQGEMAIIALAKMIKNGGWENI